VSYRIIKLETNAQGLVGWLAVTQDDENIGHIFMQEELNKRIKFLDAWVREDSRRQGIFRKLWDTRWQHVIKNYKGWTAFAWCLPSSLPLLIEKGFIQGDTSVYVEKEIKDDNETPFTFVTC